MPYDVAMRGFGYALVHISDVYKRQVCGNARAAYDKVDNAIRVGDPASINALRAAICLAWQLQDNGTDMTSVALPEFTL